ncbi:MAG: chloride channel protein [Luteolibacter sp.]|jgi:H+/Cl- antiporter ClcA
MRLARIFGTYAVVAIMATLVGSASAFFLWSLDAVTLLRFDNPWIIWLLPVAGLAIGLMYYRFGGDAGGGQDLLIDEIHEPGAGVPRRMAPLVLFGTLMTHLFGGSAGREGTALQMGGGIAAAVAKQLRASLELTRILLMAGIAAGFGSIFGTPVAGAVFALEVLVFQRLRTGELLVCLFAAILADQICHAWGAQHLLYEVQPLAEKSGSAQLWGAIVIAAALFGLCARLFVSTSHRCLRAFTTTVRRPWMRPFVGGIVILTLVAILSTRDYLGLGVIAASPESWTLPRFFTDPGAPATAWLWKLIFTVITIGAGFKGGEVTPLFFIGAALGNLLAWLLGAPVDLFAALGFLAVFAAATKTPIASIILGIELFGGDHVLAIAAACIIACQFSGASGIYRSMHRE